MASGKFLIGRVAGLSDGPMIDAMLERLEAMERDMIYSALKKKEWVQTQAADLLGISERVLRYKMKKYAIKRMHS